MPTVCLVAGDPSGDAHGAHLVEALRRLDPSLRAIGLGGAAMRAAGVDLRDELTHAAAIGPFDASKHLGRFVQAKRRFADALRTDRPDAVILIDFGDFNLPVLAPLAKRAGCRVIYYVSPQIWAWGRFRLRWVRRYVDRMLVLFPFEEQFYRQAGVPVTWVGHPMVERAVPTLSREQAVAAMKLNPWRMTVGLLPGSRGREVSRHLPLMIDAAERIAWAMPGVQFLLPMAPQLPEAAFAAAKNTNLTIHTVTGRMHEALPAMDAAIVASGTATLEAALLGVPMAVVYRTSLATFLAAKTVLRVPNIAMVNVIAGRTVVPEFVQFRAQPPRIAEAIVELLRSPERRAQMRVALEEVRQQLGPPGAVERAARAVLAELQSGAPAGTMAP
jgi:lipid-A-disaccharide synthase